MVDLHTHILPELDDGAANVLDALELLKLEHEQGTDKIVFTPHFNIDNQDTESFIENRDRSFAALNEAARCKNQDYGIEFKLGAEVYLSPKLLDEDLNRLCIQDTSYMLIEFPSDYYRTWTVNTLYDISCQNIVPVIAHAERYPYFYDNYEELVKMVEIGALIQVNASSIVKHKSSCKKIYTLIKHNLVHCIASDTHSLYKRPPMLTQAFKAVENKFNSNEANKLIDNANRIFDGLEIEVFKPSTPKRIFGITY